ncbi:hypothetical protein RJO15_11705 [Herbaspirillum huttiense F1]|uniref:hypothetical protein n=1 Tax=Herbaspirillum huttiense TaxID=863372 RepID=UPI002884A3D2|nr:hypothetical protein [Herbaspirillum huttiense]MDT0356440.1 hypothetical protein [Herbaspirillum huttiense F1]
MGIAQAGIVFRPLEPLVDIESFVSGLFGTKVVQIEHPDIGQFDIRHPGDVMVQRFEDAYFVCNNDLVWDLLEFPQTDVTQTYRRLGSPHLFMAFCHYDSGGSYGYAFFEGGKRTRSRLQTVGSAHRQALIEYGAAKDFERNWLSANFYLEEDDCPREEWQKIYFQGNREIEVPEYFLTKRILEEGMVGNFGVCPWDTNLEPSCYFFKAMEKKRHWWQFWKD